MWLDLALLVLQALLHRPQQGSGIQYEPSFIIPVVQQNVTMNMWDPCECGVP